MEFLVTTALVSSGDLPAVVDLPNVRVGRAGKINRSEYAVAEQKAVMFPLLLVGVNAHDVTSLVDANGAGFSSAREINRSENAVTKNVAVHVLLQTDVFEVVCAHDIAVRIDSECAGMNGTGEG